MSIVVMLNRGLSLRRALQMVDMSRGSYYYKPKSGRSDGGKFRDPTVLDRIRGMALMKPIYGTRMMAARLSRELGRPVSRKLVQHAFRAMGWTVPQMTKRQMLGAKGRAKPMEINQLWQSDLTYICSQLPAKIYSAASPISLPSIPSLSYLVFMFVCISNACE